MFYNGRKPVVRPLRYSVKRMRDRPSPKWGKDSVQGRITHEAEQFLLNAAHSIRGRNDAPAAPITTTMIERFLQVLTAATERIPEEYFQLPVGHMEAPIYRERVYCYELYHQLRTLLEDDEQFSRYALSGEIDKQGHPIIRPCAPDFVFHAPGDMNSNLVVVEVKPVNAELHGIRKDLQTLTYFVSDEARYQLGILLVYGDSEMAFEKFKLPSAIRSRFGV